MPFHDLRYALRVLVKSPGFTAAAAIALALGIGANTAIFTVADSVLFRPLPYADPARLVVALHEGRFPVSPADFLDYRRGVTAFEQLGAAQAWGANLTGREKTEAIPGMQVTANLLPLLGIPPLLGRTFDAGDDRRALVLSHALWQRRFGADPKIIGQALTLNAEPYTVIGVMPASFQFAPFWATQTEMWTPLILTDRIHDRAGRSLRVFGRLRRGVGIEQAQAQMDAIAGQLAARYPKTNAKLGIRVVPLQEKVIGPIRPTLLVLLGTVGFVLLIACANVANLMLTRAIGRRKEIALRIAIGASRGRLMAQLLTESLLLAFIGGGAGLALAASGVRLLAVLLPPGSMPRQREIGFNAAAFLFALAATVLTGLLTGMAPAWQLSQSSLNENLKSRARKRTHGLLIGSEVALALVLLAGAGLMVRTSINLQRVDPGFQPHNLLTLTVSVAGTAFDQPRRRPILFQQVSDRIASLPGVESVSAINHLPIGGDLWSLGYTIPGRPDPPPGEGFSAVYRVARTRYFETMRLTILQGRGFTDHDAANAPLVAVINEAMARRRWPGANPVGQQVAFGEQQVRTIIGVVKDARQADWTSPIDDEIYLPYLQRTQAMGLDYLTFVIRTQGDPGRLTAAVRQRIWDVDRNLPISHIASMEEVIASHLWRSRLSVLLLSLFAGIALLLTALGIYGVIAYSVRRQTREIGIRIALGARRADVLWLAFREGMLAVIAGAVTGEALAFAASRWMASLLYGVKAGDALTYVAVTLILLGVAAVANYIPARRAAGLDPLAALRHE